MFFKRPLRLTGYIPKYSNISKNHVRSLKMRVSSYSDGAHSRFTRYIFVSAAAVGLSVLISHKRKTLCEAIEVSDSKELNISRSCHKYEKAISKSYDLLQRLKDEVGAPGMVVGVSIDGRIVWTEGLGYSDVENRVLCSSDTVMRIASISKSISMMAVAKLWEDGKLDLDKPIQDYVPYFPQKDFNKKPVTITCRQLVSHLGGIRHYHKVVKSSPEEDKSSKNAESEFDHKEYYIKDHFKDVKSSLDLFKDDRLVANPGSKFYYSTHGWTLISAIVEAASKETFSIHITKLFNALGMYNTYLDVNDDLIYYRSRYYVKDIKGRLINAPYVDNSYKWAAGGFLSTVGDLLKFGNVMLYSLQFDQVNTLRNTKKDLRKEQCMKNSNQLQLSDLPANGKPLKQNFSPGYLNSKTVESLWTPVADSKEGKYGMGWFILPEVKECQFCESKMFVYHTGGAVGASSVLLILPQSFKEINDFNQSLEPKGIVVAILTNLQSVALQKTALKIAQIFDSETK